MFQRPRALLTLVVTDVGSVEVEPGEGFEERHLDLMAETTVAVKSVLADYPSFLSFGIN